MTHTTSALHNLDHIVSCVSGYDPDALSVGKAQEVIQAMCAPVAATLATESVSVRSAMGRILANDLVSPFNVPSHTNAAMDGYAFDGKCLDDTKPEIRLRCVGEALAGQGYGGPCELGECVRVMTGAVMPQGCDTVIPQEFTERQGTEVVFLPRAVRPLDNRRLAGEDLAQGMPALLAGRRIRPADLGLAASLGRAELPVRRALRVAFFSTGSELRSVGEPLAEGCVYDSNRYTIFGMLARLGVDVIDMGVVPDNPEALEHAFRTAAASADAVVTSGGVSVGEADYTRAMMARLGDVAFWRIAMRPGRPMAFGRIWAEQPGNGHSAVLFGLPGNPVAVMVTFYVFVRQGLMAMAGETDDGAPMLQAVCAETIKKKPGRTEYRRGQLFVDTKGRVAVRTTGGQGSGILRSMSDANCLLVLGHDVATVEEGQAVEVLPFDGLV